VARPVSATKSCSLNVSSMYSTFGCSTQMSKFGVYVEQNVELRGVLHMQQA
jgi:hypothetical protein